MHFLFDFLHIVAFYMAAIYLLNSSNTTYEATSALFWTQPVGYGHKQNTVVYDKSDEGIFHDFHLFSDVGMSVIVQTIQQHLLTNPVCEFVVFYE